MWIFNKKEGYHYCNKCGSRASLSPFCSTELLSNYCPQCGDYSAGEILNICNEPKTDCEYYYDMSPGADYSEQWCTRDYNHDLLDGRISLHCENCKYYKKKR